MRLVDADAMLDRFKRVFEKNKEYKVADGLAMAYDMIQGQPTVEAQNVNTVPVRYARLVKSEIADGYIVCSRCGVTYPLSMKQSVFLNYCSRCGAKFI